MNNQTRAILKVSTPTLKKILEQARTRIRYIISYDDYQRYTMLIEDVDFELGLRCVVGRVHGE